jgi:hypothetical protein
MMHQFRRASRVQYLAFGREGRDDEGIGGPGTRRKPAIHPGYVRPGHFAGQSAVLHANDQGDAEPTQRALRDSYIGPVLNDVHDIEVLTAPA